MFDVGMDVEAGNNSKLHEFEERVYSTPHVVTAHTFVPDHQNKCQPLAPTNLAVLKAPT